MATVKIVREDPRPVIPPIERVILELTEAEAQELMKSLSPLSTSFSVYDALNHGLKG